MSAEGYRIATYDHPAEANAPVVLAVHGFSSSAYANWQATGWIRELGRAGYRVISFDQRGHGASDKPHDPAAYTMAAFVADAEAVIGAYLLDEVTWVGYSLGARVGWHAAIELPHRITRAVFGGIPDGDPLTRFRVDEARAFLSSGRPVEDRLTQSYLRMAAGIRGNDLEALVSLVEGMRGGAQPDPADPPSQPLLFATGSEDPILDASRTLAEACPAGAFYEIPGRNHFNAPTSRDFRARALEFLAR
jgi:pimeloyl-ACP methyl ester carboxylesterase